MVKNNIIRAIFEGQLSVFNFVIKSINQHMSSKSVLNAGIYTSWLFFLNFEGKFTKLDQNEI